MAINIDQIPEKIYSLIVADTTIRTITGWTSSDPRVYEDWHEFIKNSTYITYFFEGLEAFNYETMNAFQQFPNLTLNIDIWSTKDQASAKSDIASIWNELITLLNGLNFEYGNWIVKNTRLTLPFRDIPDTENKDGVLTYHRHMEFELGPIFSTVSLTNA